MAELAAMSPSPRAGPVRGSHRAVGEQPVPYVSSWEIAPLGVLLTPVAPGGWRSVYPEGATFEVANRYQLGRTERARDHARSSVRPASVPSERTAGSAETGLTLAGQRVRSARRSRRGPAP